MSDTDQRHRVVVMGPGKVGKTCILKRFLFNTYTEDYKETVEDLYCRDYNVRGTCMKVRYSVRQFSSFSLLYDSNGGKPVRILFESHLIESFLAINSVFFPSPLAVVVEFCQVLLSFGVCLFSRL